MTDRPPGWDHAVIVVNDLDGAARAFEALGFALTDEAHHTAGTSNRLALLENGFIELVTVRDPAVVEPGYGFAPSVLRALARGDGLAFMVTQVADAEAEKRRLQDEGIDARGPFSLKRGEGKACRAFSLTFGHDARLPRVGFFACERSAAPEAGAAHPNGAAGLLGAVIVDEAPTDHHIHYAGMMGLRDMRSNSAGLALRYADGTGLDVLTPQAYAAYHEPPRPAPTPYFAALRIGTSLLERTAETLNAAVAGDRVVAEACGVRIVFERTPDAPS